MSNDSNEDRKIIIDEDWKSQVEQEREQLKSGESPAKGTAADATSADATAAEGTAADATAAEASAAEGTAADATAAETSAAETSAAETGAEQIPEASFALLVTTLATQAMAALGQIPDPSQNKPVIHVGLARHFVDTLSMLEEKTKGNLDAEESAMLEQVLHQLRLLFVAVQNAPSGGE